MKILIRLLSIVLPVSLVISAFSFSWPAQADLAAGEGQIVNYGELIRVPVSPELAPPGNITEGPTDAAPSGSISGHVYREDGSTPIQNALLSARLTGNEYSYSGTARSVVDGIYLISALPPGNYRLEVSVSGYVDEYYNGTLSLADATLILVTGSNVTSGIDFTLQTGGFITGHIYLADGATPLPGAIVQAVLADVDYYYYEGDITGPDGGYTISELPTGNYRVMAYISGSPQEHYHDPGNPTSYTLVAVADSATTSGIDLTLDIGGSISGHVYQSDGKTPIADATVYAEGNYGKQQTLTLADGSYTLGMLSSGSFRVEVEAAGYIQTYYDGVSNVKLATLVNVTAPLDTPDIDFALNTGGSISGCVYQTDGVTPVAGATLYAYLSSEGYSYYQTATSTSDGRYTFAGLPPGSYSVEASASGYIDEYYNNAYDYSLAARVTVADSAVTSGIDFILDTGGSISGFVYQTDGVTPVNNASISAHLQFADYSYSRSAHTDPSGKYILTLLPSGSYTVQAQASNYLTEYNGGTYNYHTATLVRVDSPNDTPNIDFALDTGGSICGHVYQADGITPVAEADVSASFWIGGESYGKSAYSASDGSFTISGLVPGSYQVRAEADGYMEEYYRDIYSFGNGIPVPVTLGNTTSDIDFTLETGGSISGHIYGPDGVTPVSRAFVEARPVSGQTGNATISSSDGSYTIPRLPTGMYKIKVQAENYPIQYYNGVIKLDLAASVFVVAPQNTSETNIILKEGGSISGHIYQAGGTTPVKSEISVMWIKGPSQSDIMNPYVKTSPDGSYQVTGLNEGEYRVSASARGYIPEYYGGVYDSSEATLVSIGLSSKVTDIDFYLDTGATISGHVYQADGVTPVEEAAVWIPAMGINYVRTLSDGSYSIHGLASGSYQICVDASGYLSEYYDGAYYSDQAAPVVVTAPETTSNIDFTLSKGASISGRVYLSDGLTPFTGRYSIQTIPASTGKRPPMLPIPAPTPESIIGSDYKLRNLPPGDYRLKITSDGYLPEYYNGGFLFEDAIPVTAISGSETPDINFILEPGGSISGYVHQADGATAIPDAHVSAELTGAGYDYGVQTNTATDGSYVLNSLPSGSYKVNVEVKGYIGGHYGYIYVSEEASPVTVTVPGNTSGIDFSLEKYGDANQDGEVNMGDVTKVEMIILGLAEETPLADANRDGKINMGDVVRIELNILGL